MKNPHSRALAVTPGDARAATTGDAHARARRSGTIGADIARARHGGGSEEEARGVLRGVGARGGGAREETNGGDAREGGDARWGRRRARGKEIARGARDGGDGTRERVRRAEDEWIGDAARDGAGADEDGRGGENGRGWRWKDDHGDSESAEGGSV